MTTTMSTMMLLSLLSLCCVAKASVSSNNLRQDPSSILSKNTEESNRKSEIVMVMPSSNGHLSSSLENLQNKPVVETNQQEHRKTAVDAMDWDVNYVAGSSALDYRTDGNDQTASMTWTKTIGRAHTVELYKKGCLEKIVLDEVNGPFVSVTSRDLENVYNPSDVDTQYFAIDIIMKSDIHSTPYFNIVSDDTATIEFCVRVDLVMNWESSPNIFETAGINFEEVAMTLQINLQTIAGFSLTAKLEKEGPNNCHGAFDFRERDTYVWDDFQDYSMCGRYACLKQNFTGAHKNKPITSIHFPLFMTSDLDSPKKEEFIVEFYRPGCKVSVPNSVLTSDIILPEVMEGDTADNTPDIVAVGTWENARIKLSDDLFEKKNGNAGRISFCVSIRRACLPSLGRHLLHGDGDTVVDNSATPDTILLMEEYELDVADLESTPVKNDEARNLGQVDSDYNLMIVETDLAVELDENGTIIGYDPSQSNTTYEYTQGGNNSAGVVVNTKVDYDFHACQCNLDTMTCEPSTLGNGGILHLCFLFTNQTSPDSGVVWAGVNYLFLTRSDNNEVDRTPINNKVPDGLTAIYNTGTQAMGVSTVLTSSFFNPAAGLIASGTLLVGFGGSTTTRRLHFEVDLPSNEQKEEEEHVSASILSNDFFDWTNTLAVYNRRRQLLQKKPGSPFNIQIELQDNLGSSAGKDETASISNTGKKDTYRRSSAAQWGIGSAIIGCSLVVTCFVLVVLKRKADREEQECLDHVHKKEILPNGSRTLIGRRTSSVNPYSDVTDYKSESATTTTSYPSNKRDKKTLKTNTID